MMREKPSNSNHKNGLSESYWLVLHNDDHNSFDDVIKALVDVCDHDVVQAEQCAVITHFTGSCEIKRGDLDMLTVMWDSLIARNLSVELVNKQ